MPNHSYDEDLSKNDFFNTIQTHEDGEIFRKAVAEGWLICVPRKSALLKYSNTLKEGTKKKTSQGNLEYNQNFLLRHILIPNDELPESHFISLDENEIRITGDSVHFIKKQSGITLYIHHC